MSGAGRKPTDRTSERRDVRIVSRAGGGGGSGSPARPATSNQPSSVEAAQKLGYHETVDAICHMGLGMVVDVLPRFDGATGASALRVAGRLKWGEEHVREDADAEPMGFTFCVGQEPEREPLVELPDLEFSFAVDGFEHASRDDDGGLRVYVPEGVFVIRPLLSVFSDEQAVALLGESEDHEPSGEAAA